MFSLTRAGLEFQSALRLEVIAAQDRLMAPLSEHERETLKDLLARVIKASAVHAVRDDGRHS